MRPADPPAGPLLGFPRALDLAQRDLKAIADRLDVIHAEGWHPAKPDHDRPTPQREPDPDPDKVPGEKWDCGLAVHKARQAWDHLTGHLSAAEYRVEEMMGLLLARQPAPVRPCRATSLLDAQRAVRRLQGRLRGVQRIHELLVGNDVPKAQWLGRALMGERGHPQFSALWHVEQAMYVAQGVVAEVGDGKPPAPCGKCRRVGSIGQPRKGGLCFACHQARYRLERRQRQAKVRSSRADQA